MKIRIENGLPIVSINLKYNNRSITLEKVLLDTGSSNTIIDTDLVQKINLFIDPINGKARRMYGIGGESELCYEQKVNNLIIETYTLNDFSIQLGITRETYGFDGILGTDFILYNKLILDFSTLNTY